MHRYEFEGTGQGEPIAASVVDDKPPVLVGASSTSNQTVLVTFNEPMGDSAALVSSYSLQQIGQDLDGPLLRLVRAEFSDSTRTAVVLTTLPQSEVSYRLSVNNARDRAGNQLDVIRAGLGQIVNPRVATFPGIGPVASDDLDGDHDGLSDTSESFGWLVEIRQLNGRILSYRVSSEPAIADTDGDLLTDDVERSLGSDPRRADTDGDGLSDNDEFNIAFSDSNVVDTDSDGLPDALEFRFFKTSPIFSDTDGDQFSDVSEINLGIRNPLIADLPRPRLVVGDIALDLDSRFTYTDTQGKSQTTSKKASSILSERQANTLGKSSEEATKVTAEVGTNIETELEFPKGTSKNRLLARQNGQPGIIGR